jgi:Na+/melibiose symporter-like transporter
MQDRLILTIIAIPVALVVPRIVMKTGKRNLLIYGAILYIAASVCLSIGRGPMSEEEAWDLE